MNKVFLQFVRAFGDIVGKNMDIQHLQQLFMKVLVKHTLTSTSMFCFPPKKFNMGGGSGSDHLSPGMSPQGSVNAGVGGGRGRDGSCICSAGCGGC